MILKTDSAGNLKWMKTYSDPSADEWVFNYFESIEITADGGYLACGSKAIFDDSKLFVLKTDSLGDINPTKIESNDITNNISFYPNPFSNYATLRINPYILDKSFKITIIDIFGRILSIKPILNEFTLINRANLPTGVYFLEISNADSDKLFVSKFIIKDE